MRLGNNVECQIYLCLFCNCIVWLERNSKFNSSTFLLLYLFAFCSWYVHFCFTLGKNGPKKEACAISQGGATDGWTMTPKGWVADDGISTRQDVNGVPTWYHAKEGATDGSGEWTNLPPAGRDANKGCVGGNRVFYPCGLGAKYVFNDTYAIGTADGILKLDERAEKIAFDYDYVYSIRNMDPEAKFKASELSYLVQVK